MTSHERCALPSPKSTPLPDKLVIAAVFRNLLLLLGFSILPQGMEIVMPGDRKKQKVDRLNRIAGQVQGLARMVADDRYCIDILHQIQAVKAALARAESEILRDHAAHCVADAMASGNPKEQTEKVDELVDLFDRARR